MCVYIYIYISNLLCLVSYSPHPSQHSSPILCSLCLLLSPHCSLPLSPYPPSFVLPLHFPVSPSTPPRWYNTLPAAGVLLDSYRPSLSVLHSDKSFTVPVATLAHICTWITISAHSKEWSHPLGSLSVETYCLLNVCYGRGEEKGWMHFKWFAVYSSNQEFCQMSHWDEINLMWFILIILIKLSEAHLDRKNILNCGVGEKI